MKISTLLRKLPVFMVICALGLTASSAFSQEKGKAKAKGKEKTETNGKHGREAGELPYGLERHSERKDELPSGLQKKKDEDGQLTRGLEEGGKKFKVSEQRWKGFQIDTQLWNTKEVRFALSFYWGFCPS
jgi:hypothetical protein